MIFNKLNNQKYLILEAIKKKINRFLFTRKQQKIFLEDIGTLIKDGVPAPQAINTVFEVAKGIPRYIAKDMLDNIAEGKRISESMEFWFSPTIVEVIRSGEEGGTFVKTLDSAVNALSKQTSAVTSLFGSIIYPITVFMLAIGVSIFLKHSVFENFAKIKPIETWPTEGKTVVAVASYMENWWWTVLLIIGGIIFLIKQTLSKSTGEIRYFIDEIPFLSLYRFFAAASFMETLGLLLNNGVAFKQALLIIQRNSPRYVEWHIHMMQQRLSGGKENIADVLDTGMVPTEDILRLKIMAKGKGFSQALISLGEHELERSAIKIKLSGRVFGGLLLAVNTLILMYMIFAVYAVGSILGT